MSEYLIIGPSNAGKSALLATLFHAVAGLTAGEDSSAIRLLNANEPMQRLIADAQSTIRQGRLPIMASRTVTEFRFDLSVEQRFWGFRTGESVATFRVWDGPGGALFPTNEDKANPEYDHVETQEFRAELVQALKRAAGLMICVDSAPQDHAPTVAMFEQLPLVFYETGLATLPAERVAVCLTKADRAFYRHGTRAQARLATTPPRKFATESIMPLVTAAMLRNFCANALVGFGWTSVYGFLDNGQPNYDAEHDGLMFREIDQRGVVAVVNAWKPYRVVEPFRFLASGDRGNLECVAARSL